MVNKMIITDLFEIAIKEGDDIHTGDVINFIVFASNNCAHFNPKNMVVYDENVICL